MKLPHHFTARFDSPTMPSKKTARVGDEGKAVRRGERRRLCCFLGRSPDLCILTWIKEADRDPVVEIISRVPNEGAVFRAD